MKKLYLFDFDGTLTKADTLFLFLKHYDSSKYFINFAKHIPLFIMLKLKMANAEKVKKSFVASILKGESQEKIDRKAASFFEENYPNILRNKALEFIENTQSEHTESYIVTASLDIWVKPFAEKLQMKLIATEAKFENGIFTGHFKTKNCNGQEKVNRIKKAIQGQKFDKSIAFGDTDGDKEMLAWANEGYFQFFH